MEETRPMLMEYRKYPILPSLLAVMMLTLFTIACAKAADDHKTSKSVNDFSVFWNEFRSAVVKRDYQSIVKLTHFPFKTKGLLDDEGERVFDRHAFTDLLPKLLAQDTGMRAEPETMRSFIERTTSVDNVDATGGEIYLGAFVFELIDDEWFFTRAYIGEE